MNVSMSKSAVWLFLSFLVAVLAFVAMLSVGFWVPLALIVLATVLAVIGLIVDISANRRS